VSSTAPPGNRTRRGRFFAFIKTTGCAGERAALSPRLFVRQGLSRVKSSAFKPRPITFQLAQGAVTVKAEARCANRQIPNSLLIGASPAF